MRSFAHHLTFSRLLLWVHSPNTKHVRVCVHVEYSCILRVVDALFSIGSIDAYIV
jgi:hypothetical protein